MELLREAEKGRTEQNRGSRRRQRYSEEQREQRKAEKGRTEQRKQKETEVQ